MNPNPVNDALATIREVLQDYLEDATTSRLANEPTARAAQKGLDALDTLLWSLQPNPMLHVQAEAFCSEVEQLAAYREQQGKGGQHVPCSSMLQSMGPSAFKALQRYAREFRAAMERKPDICRCPTNHHVASCPLEP